MKTAEDGIVEHLRKEIGSDLREAAVPRAKRVTIEISPTVLRKAVIALMDEYSQLRFITLSAIDKGLDLEFLHHFDIDGTVLTLKSSKPKEENTLESIVDLIPAANFIEREIADLFGVKLLGHPRPEPLILTKDWPEDERPLRKPLEGEVPEPTRPVVEALISTSCVAAISSFIQRRREKAGLPGTPPFAFTDESTLREFQEIIRTAELDKKVGYSWEKKKMRY